VDKSKISLAISAGAVVILLGALWIYSAQTNQEMQSAQGEQALAQGISLFDDKQYPEALEALQRVPQGSSYEAKARYYRGVTQMMLKDFEAAASQLEGALELQGQDPATLFALGVSYFKLGNLKLARGYFAAVLEIPATSPKQTELMEEAKGLMDIMAQLERQQPGADSTGQSAASDPDKTAIGRGKEPPDPGN
jgi:tetratricopeptide (TPR) repeat protein